MTDEAAVLTEARGRVLLITLNRPDAMNSINGALSTGLVEAIAELDSNAPTPSGSWPATAAALALAWTSRPSRPVRTLAP